MDINTIKDYIIKKYPDSSLAYNYNRNYYCDEELMEGCENFFYYEKLRWCGCGDPDSAKEVVKEYLQAVKARRVDVNNDLVLCLAYTMDAAGLTDHGSSICGAWLTDEGEMFLWLLEQNGR